MYDFILTILFIWSSSAVLSDAYHFMYIIRELINLKNFDLSKDEYKIIKKAFINFEITDNIDFTTLIPIFNLISEFGRLKNNSIDNYNFSALQEYLFYSYVKNPKFLEDEEGKEISKDNEEFIAIKFKNNGEEEKVTFQVEDHLVTFIADECSDNFNSLDYKSKSEVLLYLLYLIINNCKDITYTANIKDAYVPLINGQILMHMKKFKKHSKKRKEILDVESIKTDEISSETYFVSYMENGEKKTIYFSFDYTGVIIRNETFDESFKDIPRKDAIKIVIAKLNNILLDISKGNTEQYEFSEELLTTDDKKDEKKLTRKK